MATAAAGLISTKMMEARGKLSLTFLKQARDELKNARDLPGLMKHLNRARKNFHKDVQVHTKPGKVVKDEKKELSALRDIFRNEQAIIIDSAFTLHEVLAMLTELYSSDEKLKAEGFSKREIEQFIVEITQLLGTVKQTLNKDSAMFAALSGEGRN